MREHDVLKKNKNFYIGVGGTVLEGLLSGSLFLLLYSVMQFLWAGQFDLNRVLMLTGAIAGIFLLRILIYSYGYTKAQIGGAEVSQNIRLFMGDHLKRIPLSRFTQGQTGDYINTITSDVNNYEKILTHKIGDLAKNFALSIMLIVFVMTIYVPAGLILLAADLLLIPGLWLSFRMVKKYGKEKNDICAENVSSIVEYVSGIQTFRAYGVGGLKNKTVISAMRDFCRISFVYEAKVLPVGAGLGILIWLSCPLVILIAYAPWAAGAIDTVSYLLVCMLPLFCSKLANAIFVDLTSYKNLMISKGKILGVMDEPEESGSMEALRPATHEIIFDHVDFAYVPEKPVLRDLSLYAKPGQKIAFVGSTGAGKTTITNLINRFYDIQAGSITYDGIDVRNIRKDDLRRSLGIVLQDTHLFTGTVMENIRYGRLDATDEECMEAAKIANAHYFISHLPQGYDTVLYSDGANLSQGQRQLVAIARAAVSRAPVLILDEATSSVDTRTEKLIGQGLDGLMAGRTVFVIAHRLSTVRNANAIMVLEQGRIIERGDHRELLDQKGKYYQLCHNMIELT